MHLRVPTPDVSVVDLVARLGRPASAAVVNAALRRAVEGELRGILGFTDEPLVSSDFVHDERSGIVDEWGYSCRVMDLAAHVARTDCGDQAAAAD